MALELLQGRVHVPKALLVEELLARPALQTRLHLLAHRARAPPEARQVHFCQLSVLQLQFLEDLRLVLYLQLVGLAVRVAGACVTVGRAVGARGVAVGRWLGLGQWLVGVGRLWFGFDGRVRGAGVVGRHRLSTLTFCKFGIGTLRCKTEFERACF